MASIPLSCADFTFPLLPHDAAFQLIGLLGLQGVDIGLFTGRSHLRPEHVLGRETAAAKDVASRLHDLGLRVADVFIQTGEQHHRKAVNHPDPSEREAGREMFRSALEFTAASGSRHLTGLPGVAFDGVPSADSLRLAAQESAWRAAEASAAGITYGVEAHVGSIIPTPELTLSFLQQADGVSLTLDYGHFIHAGFSNEAIHPLLSHASHFHARGGAPGRLQTAVSENEIDFDRIAASLLERNYAGWVCLEYVWVNWQGCSRNDNVSETSLLRDLFLRRMSA